MRSKRYVCAHVCTDDRLSRTAMGCYLTLSIQSSAFRSFFDRNKPCMYSDNLFRSYVHVVVFNIKQSQDRLSGGKKQNADCDHRALVRLAAKISFISAAKHVRHSCLSNTSLIGCWPQWAVLNEKRMFFFSEKKFHCTQR